MPNQRKPWRSWRLANTEFSGSPSATVRCSKRKRCGWACTAVADFLAGAFPVFEGLREGHLRHWETAKTVGGSRAKISAEVREPTNLQVVCGSLDGLSCGSNSGQLRIVCGLTSTVCGLIAG